MSITGPRLLDQHFSAADIQLGDPIEFPATLTGDNWAAINNDPFPVGTPTFVTRSYYDLTGINMEDLTTFIQRIDIQEAFPLFGTAACQVIDLVTTEEVTDSQLLAAWIYNTGGGQLPGFLQSEYNMEQVIYGRTRTYQTSNTWSDLGLKALTTWGTGSATAGTRLFLTRVVMVLAQQEPMPGQTVHIPACAYVAGVILLKEPELEHMMRLKRSFEIDARAG
jgi:hypothetical protein